jgi:hypothetical protein
MTIQEKKGGHEDLPYKNMNTPDESGNYKNIIIYLQGRVIK